MSNIEAIDKYIQLLQKTARCVTFKRHAYLYMQNDVADTVYLIKSGMVMLTKLLDDGDEVGVMLLSQNSLLGYSEVISGSRRENQVITVTPCTVWEFNAHLFLECLKQSSEFALAIACLESERLTCVQRQLGTISQSCVSKRLASTLLALANSANSNKSANSAAYQSLESLCITPCPTHQDLATMISSTRETVSAIMGKLRKRNIIDFNRKELKILDVGLLQEYESH